MRPAPIVAAALILLSLAGCEGEKVEQGAVLASRAAAKHEMAPAAPAEGPAGAGSGAGSPAVAARKIIFTGNVSVTVEDFGRAEQALQKLVAAAGGYLAESNVNGSPGAHRSGTWKARIPVKGFDGFVDGVAALGEPVLRRTTSEDVSDEFFDLEARIKNKKAEEARLIRHLEVSTGKLEEILQVERELSRVREEVERMQGRRQVLENLTTLTTVTVSIEERTGYIAPESPRFATRLARSFRGSVDQLLAFGEWIALTAAALLPWVPVVAVGLALYALIRRRTRPRPNPTA